MNNQALLEEDQEKRSNPTHAVKEEVAAVEEGGRGREWRREGSQGRDQIASAGGKPETDQ